MVDSIDLARPTVIRRMRSENNVAVTALGLTGTWQRAVGTLYRCRASRVSMTAARMLSITKPEAGDEVIISLAAFNPLKGTVATIFPDGFSLDLGGIAIDDMIELAIYAREAGMVQEDEERAHFRVIPKQKLARVDMLDDRHTFSRIIDVSRSGIAIETRLLCINEAVEVGGRSGRVVRIWGHGAAIQFDKIIEADLFTDQISFR